ncbi:Ppx/GppA phosphatase family protein [Brevundimonas sp.]|uniref:Ppx/GppA phosphatase family protein n=1 Tax=Brevundimonas sp. TaxID=1871086 RepID=UPI0035B11A00
MPHRNGAPRGRDDGSRRGREAPLYAALDLGTNNCRLLVARPARDGFRVVDSFSRIVRLGQGLSASGALAEAAMDRAVDALQHCAEKIARRGVSADRVSAVATQACRMAGNGEAFIARVRTETGIQLRIIEPEEEAALAVAGCRNLLDSRAPAALIVDVGGGSTELSWLSRRGQGDQADWIVIDWMSMPLGVVSLAERWPEPDGGGDPWYESMVDDVRGALKGREVAETLRPHFETGAAHLVGTSGAITSLAGVHLGLARYERSKVDGLWMDKVQCQAAARKLHDLGPDGRAREACIGPDRADLVLAGAAILEGIQREWPCPRVRVADRGLREGLLLNRMRQERG